MLGIMTLTTLPNISMNLVLKHRKMKVEENVAKEKCLKAPKCFWYYKGGFYVSPYIGCIRK